MQEQGLGTRFPGIATPERSGIKTAGMAAIAVMIMTTGTGISPPFTFDWRIALVDSRDGACEPLRGMKRPAGAVQRTVPRVAAMHAK